MTPDKFKKYSEKFIKKNMDILYSKSEQYSPLDVFSNFQQGANIVEEEKERVLFLYMLKHLVFIAGFFKPDKYIYKENVAKIQESIGDVINYMIILSAMLKEKYNGQ